MTAPARSVVSRGAPILAFTLIVTLGITSHLRAQTCEDLDGDGFYAALGCGTVRDCNDDDVGIYPGAAELCDGRDNDCNGLSDDALECDGTCDNPETAPGPALISSDNGLHTGNANVVWIGDGWVVAYVSASEFNCDEVLLQKLDPLGNLVGSPVSVAGGVEGDVWIQYLDLAWTGSQVAVTWNQGPYNPSCSAAQGDFETYFRQYTSGLEPSGGILELDCSQSSGPTIPRIAWSGSVYGLVWRNFATWRFTTITRDGSPTDSCGMVIPGNAPINYPSLTWNGEYFGLSWSEQPPESGWYSDIYFRRITEDMTIPDPGAVRVTLDPARSNRSSLVWADGEWGVSWADHRDSALLLFEIYLVRLNPDGTKIDPPGDIRVTCCNDENSGVDRWYNKLNWTGAEFGLSYLAETHPATSSGDLFFHRMDSEGTSLVLPILVTPDQAREARGPIDMDWNGDSYGLVWRDIRGSVSTREIYFRRMGCNCVDVDTDGFSTCAGGDCDDSNPLINPSVSELCLDGEDNDCNGRTDCQDTAVCSPSAGVPPGEVAGVGFDSDKETLSWQPEPDSSVYDVLTGNLAELRRDGDFSRAECLAWRQPDTSYTDSDPPLPGGRYYLVRGKADQCKLGTWGSVLRDEASLTCP